MDKNIGKKLDGRYEIKEIIGVGGMAIVYKAYDAIDDRTVAVKILKDEFLTNDEFRRRFKNESKAIAVLSHPNIVKVFDVSFSEKLQYIVMEYIDGITLKEYIDQQKVLTWKEAVHFTEQILLALQHAHEKGIVHRDIKPQNIMMLRDGAIKVTDFGIARFADSETRTMTDKAIGSVHYISPEQARGENTDDKSDIYSVGVMLFEMLTGQLPFEADSAVSVAIMQMQNEPKHPREINPEIPEGLEDIVLRAMQKEPANRYQSAADMLADIAEFKKNPSIHFEYKYFVDEDPTKYVNAINEIKGDEDADKNKKKKKRSMLPVLAGIAAAALLCVMLLAGAVLWVTGAFSFGGQIKAPNLVGQKYADVVANPQYSKLFHVVKKTTEFSNTAAAGVILSQDVKPGMGIKKNSTINVVVSSGPQTGTVPNVYNMEQSDAINELENSGFTSHTVVPTYDDNIAKGFVVSTDPVRGAVKPLNTKVTIVVSNGPAPKLIQVPTLTGISLDDAKNKIQGALLSVGTCTAVDSNLPANQVVSQSVSPGTTVSAGQTIDLTYSKGPQTVSAPSNVQIDLSQLPQSNMDYSISVYVAGQKYKDNLSYIAGQGSVISIPLSVIQASSIKGNNVEVQILVSGGDNNYPANTLFQTYSVDPSTGAVTPSDKLFPNYTGSSSASSSSKH